MELDQSLIDDLKCTICIEDDERTSDVPFREVYCFNLSANCAHISIIFSILDLEIADALLLVPAELEHCTEHEQNEELRLPVKNVDLELPYIRASFHLTYINTEKFELQKMTETQALQDPDTSRQGSDLDYSPLKPTKRNSPNDNHLPSPESLGRSSSQLDSKREHSPNVQKPNKSTIDDKGRELQEEELKKKKDKERLKALRDEREKREKDRQRKLAQKNSEAQERAERERVLREQEIEERREKMKTRGSHRETGAKSSKSRNKKIMDDGLKTKPNKS
jgi:hypothetical protein